MRVLSDGDDSAGAGGGSAGDQSTGDSQGSAQVGSPGVNAPVRVASDGDNTAAGEPAGAPEQSAGDLSGSAQVGSPGVAAPVRVASDGDATTADELGRGDRRSADGGRLERDGAGRLPAPVRSGPSAGRCPEPGNRRLGRRRRGRRPPRHSPSHEPGGDGSSIADDRLPLAARRSRRRWGRPLPLEGTRGLRDRGPAPYDRPVVNLYSGGAPLPGDGGAGWDVGDVSTLWAPRRRRAAPDGGRPCCADRDGPVAALERRRAEANSLGRRGTPPRGPPAGGLRFALPAASSGPR